MNNEINPADVPPPGFEFKGDAITPRIFHSGAGVDLDFRGGTAAYLNGAEFVDKFSADGEQGLRVLQGAKVRSFARTVNYVDIVRKYVKHASIVHTPAEAVDVKTMTALTVFIRSHMNAGTRFDVALPEDIRPTRDMLYAFVSQGWYLKTETRHHSGTEVHLKGSTNPEDPWVSRGGVK